MFVVPLRTFARQSGILYRTALYHELTMIVSSQSRRLFESQVQIASAEGASLGTRPPIAIAANLRLLTCLGGQVRQVTSVPASCSGVRSVAVGGMEVVALCVRAAGCAAPLLPLVLLMFCCCC